MSCAVWRLAAYTPIYPDEISFQFVNARAGYDRFLHSELFPACSSGCSLQMPLFWKPAKFLYWALYNPVQDLQLFRYIGIAVALCAIGMLAWLAAKALSERGISKLLTACFILAACSFGVLPFILVLNRPEPLLVLCAGWFALAPFIFGAERSRKVRIAVVLLSFAVLSLLLGLHPKSLLLMPLVLISLWTLSGNIRGRKASVAACLLALFFAAQSYAVYSKSSKCPESPRIAAFNSDQYYMPGLDLLSNPAAVAGKLLGSANSYILYITRNTFNAGYTLHWLPPVSGGADAARDTVNNALIWGFQIFVMLNVVLLIIQFSRGWRAVVQTPGGLIPLVFAFSLLGIFAVQMAKHFYEGAFIIPLSALLLCAEFMVLPSGKITAYIRLFFCATIWLAVASLLCALCSFSGKLDVYYPGPGISLAQYSRDKTDAYMKPLQALNGGWNGAHIVTDDMGYMYVKKSFQPYDLDYILLGLISERGPKAAANAPLVFSKLKELRVPAVIARCSYIKPRAVLIDNAVRSGDMCYIGPATIAALAGGG